MSSMQLELKSSSHPTSCTTIIFCLLSLDSWAGTTNHQKASAATAA